MTIKKVQPRIEPPLDVVITEINNILIPLQNSIVSLTNIPIGTVSRYNNSNNDWIDNITIPGFYACVLKNTNITYTNINGALVNIPNMSATDGALLSVIKII